jgi:hypothetical protein
MQKAMFFEEAYQKGILAKVTAGYILSVISPDMDDIDKQNDPFLIEMISYSGVKAVTPIGNGVKFQAQGKKMFCMMEPASYSEKHIEPTYRSTNSTGHMPFRMKDIDHFLTKDSKFNILIPTIAHDCYDSFTVSFPSKGDICIIYFIFDKDINGVVLPFIEENFNTIIKKTLRFRDVDANTIAKKFIEVVRKNDIFPENR